MIRRTFNAHPSKKRRFSAAQLGSFCIHCVAQSIAHEIERKDSDENRHAEREEPRIIGKVTRVLRGIQHDAPACVRFLNADVEETQDDLAENIIWNAERGSDDYIRKRVRQ